MALFTIHAVYEYTYDDWGRMITKAFGGDSAVYGYGQGSKMIKVTSTLPGEGTVDYRYVGDGKRRERDEEDGTDITWHNWDAGYTVISEEADGAGLGDGALTRTYVGNLADIAGSNPATGTARYHSRA